MAAPRNTPRKATRRTAASTGRRGPQQGISGFRVPTIQKLGELLRLFIPHAAGGRPGSGTWKLQDIARHLDWDDATTHRFLISLTEIELLERHNDDEFSVGLMTVELASVYLATNHLRNELIKKMEYLSEVSGLTAHIGVLQGNSMTIIASREGTTPLKARSLLGERVPLHVTAGGKAILSVLPDKTVSKIINGKLDKLAANSRTDPSALMKDIEDARKTGIARATSEFADGLSGLAIPIPAGHFGPFPAALACTGPTVLPLNWNTAEQELMAISEAIQHRENFDIQSDVI